LERSIVRRSRKPIIIASRRSRLARVQAEQIGARLSRLHPNLTVQYHWIESEGDQDQSSSLADRGGKGLFTRAIERALLEGKADLAVHSLKDLPAQDTAGLSIAAVPAREDVRDCMIARDGLTAVEQLPPGAVVGTSSPRRAAQLLRVRPDLQMALMRGNVETRLNKVLQADGGPTFDATLLAAAGLNRLELTQYSQTPLSLVQMLPAACQGALAIQCRSDDHVTLTRCLPLNDPSASTAVHAERQVVAGLGADCHSPLAVLAEPVRIDPEKVKRNADAHWFRLRVRVLAHDGKQCLEVDETVKTKDLRRLVKKVVKDLMDRGARPLLACGPKIGAAAQVVRTVPTIQPAN
jgi:hydroxymethylbilane synthase